MNPHVPRTLLDLLASIGLTAIGLAQPQHDLLKFHGATVGSHFGTSVAGPGDLDGDGVPDVVAGRPGFATNDVRAFSGRDGRVLWTAKGAAGSGFGFAVAPIADLDGDRVPDVLVGAPFGSSHACALSGRTGVVLAGRVFTVGAGSALGVSVASAGDVSGDGVADILVGATNTQPTMRGRVYIYSGANGALLHVLSSVVIGDSFGLAVAGVGDVNGNGTPDVLVGAPHTSGNAGAATLYEGRSLRTPGTPVVIRTHGGGAAGDTLGYSLCGIGDVDGDGRPDYAIGAPGASTATVARGGRVSIHSGANGTQRRAWTGAFIGGLLGISVGAAGDFDKDGVPDVVAGSIGASANGPGSGRVSVLSGKSSAVLLQREGEGAMDEFGICVSGAGDIDGDGHADVVAGARQTAQMPQGAGYVMVLSGKRRTMWTDRHGVLASGAGTRTQTMHIDLGTRYANHGYWVFASVTGTSPRTPVCGVQVPLLADSWTSLVFALTAMTPPPAFFSGFRGTLSATGQATARLNVPACPPCAGTTLYHATLVLAPTGCPVAATEATTLLVH